MDDTVKVHCCVLEQITAEEMDGYWRATLAQLLKDWL